MAEDSSKLTQIRRDLLARLREHGPQVERDVTSREITATLQETGYITRSKGSAGKPTMIDITDLGRAQLRPHDGCPCRRCRR